MTECYSQGKGLGFTVLACLIIFTGTTALAEQKSWRSVADLLPQEKARIDFSDPGPRDSKRPYIPAEA